MKRNFLSIFVVCFGCWQAAFAQAKLDERVIRTMPPLERFQYVQSLNLESLDSAAFLALYGPLLGILKDVKDERATWLLELEYLFQRKALKMPKAQIIDFAESLLAAAKDRGWEVEQIVAAHYLHFEQYDSDNLPQEHLYAYILKEYSRIQELGVEKFKPYDIPRILYHDARFMYDLEDFDKALKMLELSQPFDIENSRGLQLWIFRTNLIESIYQHRKAYDKGIAYAKQILETTTNCPVQKPEQLKICKIWQGIACIDIADMLVKQGKLAEGETYADRGYINISEGGDTQAEFDALIVLIPTKLDLGKMAEAATLLQKLEKIHKTFGGNDYYYFKNIRFFEAYARYYEMTGNFAAAVRYTNLAKPLKDSLERRNDARKFEKIQQRHEAEKYAEQLRMVENEKRMQTHLRNAVLAILVLVTTLAFVNFRRLRHKRRLALAELDAARSNLDHYTQTLLEKLELAENLRLEIERLSKAGERSEYLEKLTHSTILKEEDWTQFRSIFEKVHPNFIEEQKTLHPDLTQAELRYLVLEKLQLSTHEMANMLGVSDGTIRQTRMRLRRKLL